MSILTNKDLTGLQNLSGLLGEITHQESSDRAKHGALPYFIYILLRNFLCRFKPLLICTYYTVFGIIKLGHD